MAAGTGPAPDYDPALATALAAWRDRSVAATPARVRCAHPTAAGPIVASLDVVYHLDGPAHDPTIAATVGTTRVPLDSPVELEPVAIAKPWGREVWYSGIEARGVSRVVGRQGTVSLAEYLALAPRLITGGAVPVLLKVLDPLPEPVRGELYFEVHEQKREVYVVTRIDPAAWPDGVGYIRFGMSQARRRAFADDAAFRSAFLVATREYEEVRRAADEGAGDPVAERAARERVNAFTALAPLRVGDVVVVPTWLPHALQHGVQVVEFQTPTYERHIISFGQKVLTQARWDSEVAIARMSLDAPRPPEFARVGDGIERIAEFPDFAVWRAVLAPGAELVLPDTAPYAVGMCVAGALQCGGRSEQLRVGAGRGVLVPGPAIGCAIRNPSDESTAIGLFAAPGL